ncbi:MAG: hypothetical protein NTY04_02840, partial [Candidatus Staskawiczbacteria bacterium]|nr:hypothetical protein [Candidatus Staskawiczbacteria bacterium]
KWSMNPNKRKDLYIAEKGDQVDIVHGELWVGIKQAKITPGTPVVTEFNATGWWEETPDPTLSGHHPLCVITEHLQIINCTKQKIHHVTII